jgi:hypothetical protein
VRVSRLQEGGWIQYPSPGIETGMRGSCIFRVGRQLKRLLVMVLKSRKKKTSKSGCQESLAVFTYYRREKTTAYPTKRKTAAKRDNSL